MKRGIGHSTSPSCHDRFLRTTARLSSDNIVGVIIGPGSLD
jgi:hypothetical protein